MSNLSNALRDFCEFHRIRVLDTNKRGIKYHAISPKFFNNPKDYNEIHLESVTCETETICTLEIGEGELKRMAEFEQQVFNNYPQYAEYNHYNMFYNIMEQKEAEKELREKYPAVKRAYEQYSLMLTLAQSGEL